MTQTPDLIVRLSNLQHQIQEASAKGFHHNSAALALVYEASHLMDELKAEAMAEFHGEAR